MRVAITASHLSPEVKIILPLLRLLRLLKLCVFGKLANSLANRRTLADRSGLVYNLSVLDFSKNAPCRNAHQAARPTRQPRAYALKPCAGRTRSDGCALA